MVRAMCEIRLHRKKVKDLIPMMVLNETIDQLAVKNSVHWYGHALRENFHVMTRTLGYKIERQKKKGKPKRTWKKVEEEHMRVSLSRQDITGTSRWNAVVNN